MEVRVGDDADGDERRLKPAAVPAANALSMSSETTPYVLFIHTSRSTSRLNSNAEPITPLTTRPRGLAISARSRRRRVARER